MNIIKIQLGNCIDLMGNVEPRSVDLCVTSPPYKNEDGYNEHLMFQFLTHVYQLLKDNTLFFLNFGHLAEDKFRPFRVCQLAIECGFELNETIIWKKNHYRPIQGNKRLNNLTEFIFLLHKGKMPDLDRLAIGVPYADKSNVKRFAKGRDLKCRGNHWEIPYETITKKEEKLHNDRFPLQLPLMCIDLAGLKPGGLVLDPFSGSGTVAVAAQQKGLNFIGFEINENHFLTSQKRLEKI